MRQDSKTVVLVVVPFLVAFPSFSNRLNGGKTQKNLLVDLSQLPVLCYCQCKHFPRMVSERSTKRAFHNGVKRLARVGKDVVKRK